ncbi:hypothetical protein [Streptomyces mangrovisoli]|uniref:hypothetical protein n=1 Tax=Streptomyces mangrovisoli TaxID=1428628 RepID=UPI001160A819|nr:hypothetical protein [Streptomyces mangrovisoli]
MPALRFMSVCMSQEFQVPDRSAASGVPESGSGTPDFPRQTGARPDGRRGPGRQGRGRTSPASDANIYVQRTHTANDRSDTPPESFLDFLDRFSERLFAKNDKPWSAVLQLAFLVTLPAALLIAGVMVAHFVGIPGWAIATGTTATSLGGAGAVTASRRRSARGLGAKQRQGRRRGGHRAS